MNNWKHNHVLDLSTFSLEDYKTVLELTTRFKDVHKSSSRKLPDLHGRLIANLFFEPSTRTRTSFELAAKRLSADVQNFSLSASSVLTAFQLKLGSVFMPASIRAFRIAHQCIKKVWMFMEPSSRCHYWVRATD